MTELTNISSKLHQGNLVRSKRLYILGICCLCMGLLALVVVDPFLRATAGLLFILLLISFLLPFYAYIMFSPRGGQIQERLYQLVIEHLGCENPKEILDIVTGNGILALKLAMAYPHAHITGIDSWGKSWEYSRKISEENAIIAGVAGRVCFLQGDAASLRFGDGSFDAVVSNLTFHEVKAVREKGKLITEGLRVLKPGGYFVFIDLFYDERHYGKLTMLIAHLHNLGLCNFEILAIKDVISLPALMLHPKILGKAGLLYGKK